MAGGWKRFRRELEEADLALVRAAEGWAACGVGWEGACSGARRIVWKQGAAEAAR